MPGIRIVGLATVILWLLPRVSVAQVPNELRTAVRQRDEAVTKPDAATWDRLTTEDFTVVEENGSMLTKAERLAELKGQEPRAPSTVQHEQFRQYGTMFLRRFLVDDAWVLDVWVKDAKGWRVAAVQVTTVKK